MLELAKLVLRMIPESRAKVAFKPLPQDDPRQLQPDITLERNALGWEPKTALESGLARTIAYFRTQLKTGK